MLLKSFSTAKFAESKIEVCVFAAIEFEEVLGVDLKACIFQYHQIVYHPHHYIALDEAASPSPTACIPGLPAHRVA